MGYNVSAAEKTQTARPSQSLEKRLVSGQAAPEHRDDPNPDERPSRRPDPNEVGV